MASSKFEKQMKMGLGEAVRRLLEVEIRFRQGGRTEELTSERTMLLDALNRVEIDLGFDCNEDGMPDTVEIFQKAAATSCCRIMPTKPKGKGTRRVRKGKK